MAEFNFDEILSKITQNPELLNKISGIAKANEGKEITDTLPHIIDAISPVIEESKTESEKPQEAFNDSREEPLHESKTSDILGSGLSLPLSRLGEKITKNAKLLIALKPYLNKERGEIIDSAVKIAQISDLMKLAK